MRRLKIGLHAGLCFLLLVTGLMATSQLQVAHAATVRTTQTLFPESTSSSTRTQTITVPNLKSITSVTVEPSNASLNYSRSGDQVTISAGGGSPTRASYDSAYFAFYPTSEVNDFANPRFFDSGSGYTGYLYKDGGYTATNPYRPPSSMSASVTISQSGSCPTQSSYSTSSGYYSGTLYPGGCYVQAYSYTSTQYFSDFYDNVCTSTYKNGVYQNDEHCSGSAPSSKYINSNGYSGYIPRTTTDLVSDNGPCSTCTRTRVWRANYYGPLTKTIPGIYAKDYSGTLYDDGVGYLTQKYSGYLNSVSATYYYSYKVTINYLENSTPQFDLSLPADNTVVSNQTGYKTLSIRGVINKPDAGDTVTVKYKIDNQSTPTTLQTLTTTGGAQPFGPFTINVNTGWAEDNHTLSVWSEDQLGAKSNTIIRTFYYDKTAPAAPTGLSSPRQNITSLDLSWDPSTNADAIDYEVFMDGQSLGRSNGMTFFPVTGLTENHTYSFAVKAIDRGGNISTASSLLSVTTAPWDGTPDTVAPTAPTFITAYSQTDHSASLQWTPSSDDFGVMQYEILDAATSLPLGTATRPSFTLDNLLSSHSYSVAIKAIDAAGNASLESNSFTFTTLDSTAPDLLNVEPTQGSLQVPLDPTIRLEFSKTLLPGQGISGITLTGGSTSVTTSVYVDGTSLRIMPDQLLQPNTTYTITVPGDAITDLDRVPAESAYSGTFQTEESGQPSNLILNGGFELAGSSLGIANDWVSVTNSTYGWQSVTTATYGASASLTEAVPFSGLQAQKLHLASTDYDDFAEITQLIAIGGTTPFQFSAHVQLAESYEAKALVVIEWLDDQGTSLNAFTQEVAIESSEYRLITAMGITPAGTASAKVHLQLISTSASGQGTANFDDIVFKLPDNNRPAVSMMSPSGTAANPSVITIQTPTVLWTQTDPDIGTTFTNYQVHVWNSDHSSLYYDSGTVSYGGIGMVGSHTITQALKRNRQYQVQVRVFDGVNWSDWSAPSWLQVQDAQEPNDTPEEAGVVEAFNVYNGTIETAVDMDYNKFTPSFTGLYHLTLKVPEGVNYDVEIMDDAQNTVAFGSQLEGVTEELSFRATAGASYTIKIHGVDGDHSLNPYMLGISRVVYNYQYDIAGRLFMMNVQRGLHLYMAKYQYDLNGNLTDALYETIEVDE